MHSITREGHGPAPRFVCPSCGWSQRDRFGEEHAFNFCTRCGTPRTPEIQSFFSACPPLRMPEGSSSRGTPSPERVEYLMRRGLLDKASRRYVLRLSIPTRFRPAEITLYGWQDSHYALVALRSAGLLNDHEDYTVYGWPSVTSEWPDIPPIVMRTRASVCELGNLHFKVGAIDRSWPPVPLYGCPNSRELESVVLRRTVEVADYA